MSYLIGIDGGATKTHCLVSDTNGNSLAQCIGEPSNFLIRGADTVAGTLLSLIQTACSEAGISVSDCKAIVIGTTGAGRRDDAALLEAALIFHAGESSIKLPPLSVVSDALIALYNVFDSGPGAIFISGTGSILFAKDEEQRMYRIGGFGRLIGDEGSGYAIGRSGLAAASKELDGRGNASLITQLIRQQYALGSIDDLINLVYREKIDLSAFAPFVLDAARQGDSAAKKILEKETEEILLHIKALLFALKRNAVKLSFTGGLITANTEFARMVYTGIEKTFPEVEIISVTTSPVFGAVRLARRMQ